MANQDDVRVGMRVGAMHVASGTVRFATVVAIDEERVLLQFDEVTEGASHFTNVVTEPEHPCAGEGCALCGEWPLPRGRG